MLTPQLVRRLTLGPGDHPEGRPHISAASGLVRVGGSLFMVADDERHLVQLAAERIADAPLRLVRLAPGPLPAEPVARKKAKPDLEALVHLPGASSSPALLVALGSGSRPQRDQAFVFQVDEAGALAGPAVAVAMGALCAALRQRFPELNLEAAFVQHGHLHLVQRAHGGQPLNGLVRLPIEAVRHWLEGTTPTAPAPASVDLLDLGQVDGVPLGITDAAAWPAGGWIFSAVAEDTSNAYDDGRCVASVIGRVDPHGRVARCEPLHGAPKVEGIAVAGPGLLWMVTDADDPARPSELLQLRWQA
ncbi:DUF6929 family protein [Ideonella sp. BN130291]|uniref:DUF6929 family protein n=1 Tax=Ideonella sp. BN130291 TaxID=3112940 RepID=UPI002E25C0AF|nr:hypothetical protein [Ideonella sp. BN130291]